MAKVTIKQQRAGSIYAKLSAVLIKADGRRIDLGALSYKYITTAFCNYLVDLLNNASYGGGSGGGIGDFIYHRSGTGTNAESKDDTNLQTGVLSMETGNQSEGASANIYKTVATITYDDTYAITEHGLFNYPNYDSPPLLSGVMMDRSVFAAINVVSTDSIQFTYQLTVSTDDPA